MTPLSDTEHIGRAQLAFTKMHGCGNDYIYFNCFEGEIESPGNLSILLSNRHTGIGGDGVVLIQPSECADAKMRMFNQDGSEGRMCGNAIRCVAKYLHDNQMVGGNTIHIETLSGIKHIELFIAQNGLATSAQVDMGPANLAASSIPVVSDADTIVAMPLTIDQTEYEITCVSMGNPHTVVFCGEIDDLDLETIGPAFETHPLFPEGTNTEFIKVLDDHTLAMRVWERGSGETLACGTGACACAVAAIENGHCKRDTDIRVLLKGGELTIRCTKETVFMTGACTKVFDGTINVELNPSENETEYTISEYQPELP